MACEPALDAQEAAASVLPGLMEADACNCMPLPAVADRSLLTRWVLCRDACDRERFAHINIDRIYESRFAHMVALVHLYQNLLKMEAAKTRWLLRVCFHTDSKPR